jgi:hypothetical protein
MLADDPDRIGAFTSATCYTSGRSGLHIGLFTDAFWGIA